MKIFPFDATILDHICCGQKGKFFLIDLLRPVGPTKTALDYGELMHYYLRQYYLRIKEGETKTQARDFSIAKTKEFYVSLDLPIEECRSCEKNFIEYMTYWQNDTWVPMLVEQPFSVVVYEDEVFPWNDGTFGVKLVAEGVVDLQVRTEVNSTPVVDHKTTSRSHEPQKLGYQFPLYCYALGQTELIVNQVGNQKTLKPVDKYRRFKRYYSQDWLNEFMQTVIVRVLRWLRDSDNNIFLPEYTSCDKFNGCTYRAICEQAKAYQEGVIKVHYKVSEPWSPWKRR